jgi:hypothetical protein
MKIAKIFLYIIVGTGMPGCQVPPVKYVNVSPPSIKVSETSQPIKIIVKDERADKKPAEKEAVVEQFPDQRILRIVSERLAANNIKYSDTANKGELTILIKTFRVIDDGADWNAEVQLTFMNEIRTQNVETKIKLYNTIGASDAVKALSQALSAAIDDIKWNEFFPG